MATTDEFFLDTKGLCLLCLSEAKMLTHDDQLSLSKSFEVLLCYLKIDIFQLKSFEKPCFSSMKHLNNDCVRVSLCATCVAMSHKFEVLFEVWEKIAKEMELELQDIHQKIDYTDSVKMDEYQRRMKGNTKGLELLCKNVFQDFRKAVVNKCSSLINSSLPNLNVQGSFVSSLAGRQLAPLVVDEVIVSNLPSSFSLSPKTQFTGDEKPCTSSRSTGSKDLAFQDQGQLRMDFVEGELEVKADRLNFVLDNDPEPATGDVKGAAIEENTLQDLHLNSQTKEDNIAASHSSLCRSAVVSEVVTTFLTSSNSRQHEETLGGAYDINSIKRFECEICHQRFTRKREVGIHMKRHSGTKDHSCPFCSKQFVKKSDLNRHIKTHTGEKPYKCNYCHKTFSSSSNIRQHERVHIGVKPLKCDVCRRTFSLRKYLDDHMRTHTNEKRYKCKICCRPFSRSFNCRTHEKLHTRVK